jgi:hypothetical protein
MIALKMHKLAVEEMSPFEELDAPDLYFQYHPNYRQSNYAGTLVPFNLRLIHAELPKYTPEPLKAWPRLCKLEDNVHSLLSNEHNDVWKKRLETVRLAKARFLHSINVRFVMRFLMQISLPGIPTIN